MQGECHWLGYLDWHQQSNHLLLFQIDEKMTSLSCYHLPWSYAADFSVSGSGRKLIILGKSLRGNLLYLRLVDMSMSWRQTWRHFHDKGAVTGLHHGKITCIKPVLGLFCVFTPVLLPHCSIFALLLVNLFRSLLWKAAPLPSLLFPSTPFPKQHHLDLPALPLQHSFSTAHHALTHRNKLSCRTHVKQIIHVCKWHKSLISRLPGR